LSKKGNFIYIADGFKLNVLVELQPIDHISLTILASVGQQGKWGYNFFVIVVCGSCVVIVGCFFGKHPPGSS
jgi:hypothetical protein